MCQGKMSKMEQDGSANLARSVPKEMVENQSDLEGTARAMIRTYGHSAAQEAQTRSKRLEELGDPVASQQWQQIMDAIRRSSRVRRT